MTRIAVLAFAAIGALTTAVITGFFAVVWLAGDEPDPYEIG